MSENTSDEVANYFTMYCGNCFCCRLKERLRFSGWLQYAPSLLIVIILSLLSTLLYFINNSPSISIAFWIVITFDCIFLINLIIELIAIKSKLRVPECECISSQSSTDRAALSVFRIMRLRRSCRSFQKRKLSQPHFSKITECIRLQSLPSSRLGGHAYAIRFEYVCAPLTVWPVVNATQFLVAIAPSQYNRLAVIDVGLCLQRMVIEATKMEVATCWIGPGADHDSIIKHLGLRFDASEDHIICMCAVGYQSIYRPLIARFLRLFLSNSRLPLNQLFFHSDCDQSESIVMPLGEKMFAAEPFARFAPCFEGCRWAPSSFNGQPTRCVIITEGNVVRRLDFYASTHSRYYAAVASGIWLANFEIGCNALGIDGYFEKLDLEQMKMVQNDAYSLVKYDMSWIVADEQNFQSMDL